MYISEQLGGLKIKIAIDRRKIKKEAKTLVGKNYFLGFVGTLPLMVSLFTLVRNVFFGILLNNELISSLLSSAYLDYFIVMYIIVSLIMFIGIWFYYLLPGLFIGVQLIIIFFSQKNDFSYFFNSIPDILIQTVISAILLTIVNKFFLIFVRNPYYVRANIKKTIAYIFQDNLISRMLYSFIGIITISLFNLLITVISSLVVGTLLGIAIFSLSAGFSGLPFQLFSLLLSLSSPFLSLFFIFINFNFYFFFFIIQDNLSHGNQAENFSIWETLKKSKQLMSGRTWEFLRLLLSMSGWILTCIFVIPAFYVVPYVITTITIWTDQVMAEDSEIVDFG